MATEKKTTTATTTAAKKYKSTDLIMVRSLTQGELLVEGKKSGILYRWSALGDVTEMEYQDLYTLKASRSGFVYKPCFVIEDEELLAQAQWSDVKKLYDGMYTTDDIDALFKMTAQQLTRQLPKMPKGLVDAFLIEASTRIDEGSFDSINKIKAIDKACGTDLMCMVNA